MMNNYNIVLKKILFRIKVSREVMSFTQAEMAELLKISSRTYQRIESGEAGLEISMMLKIAEVLKLNLEELVSMRDPVLRSDVTVIHDINEMKLNQEELELVEYFNQITDASDVSKFIESKKFQEIPTYTVLFLNTKKYGNISISKLAQKKTAPFLDGFTDQSRILGQWDYLFQYRPKMLSSYPVKYKFPDEKLDPVSLDFYNYIDDDIYALFFIKDIKDFRLSKL